MGTIAIQANLIVLAPVTPTFERSRLTEVMNVVFVQMIASNT
jgi:hypothetical protein